MNGILPNGKQQFIDSNGNPLASGKVYYYIPSTTTFKNTYQDDAGTVLNTNPIQLDANGQCIAYGTGSYRQQVYDVNNNLIWDQQVDAPASQSDLAAFEASIENNSDNTQGDNLVGFLQSNPSGALSNAVGKTVNQKFQEMISVFDFLTSAQIADVISGNSTIDVTAGIQNALAALPTDGGGNKLGELLFPPGVYKCSGQLTIYTGTKIRGVGAILDYTNASTSITAINIIQQSTGSSVGTDNVFGDPLGGLGLTGPGSSTSSIGVLVGTTTTTAEQVSKFDMTIGHIQNFGVGIQQANNSYAFRIDGGLIWRNGVNAYFPSGLSNNAEQVEFHGVTFSESVNASIRSIGNSLDILVVGGSMDYDSGVSIDVAGDTIVTCVGTHIEFSNITVASNTSSAGNPNVNFMNCTFTPATTQTIPIINGNQMVVLVEGGWIRINGGAAITTFVQSQGITGPLYYSAVVKNIQPVIQSGSLTNIILGLGTNPNAYYESGATKSDFQLSNGSFIGDQIVTLSGTSVAELAIPFTQAARGALIVCAASTSNNGPVATWAVAAPDSGNNLGRAVINALASAGGLTTGETLSLTWPSGQNYPALSKSGSGWNGTYTVSIMGV